MSKLFQLTTILSVDWVTVVVAPCVAMRPVPLTTTPPSAAHALPTQPIATARTVGLRTRKAFCDADSVPAS